MRTVKLTIAIFVILAATRVFALDYHTTKLAIFAQSQTMESAPTVMPNLSINTANVTGDVMVPVLLTYAVASFYIAQEFSPNTRATSEVNMFGGVMVASAFLMMLR